MQVEATCPGCSGRGSGLVAGGPPDFNHNMMCLRTDWVVVGTYLVRYIGFVGVYVGLGRVAYGSGELT
jgi:hypothetical protein